jgi:hypothetical protein
MAATRTSTRPALPSHLARLKTTLWRTPSGRDYISANYEEIFNEPITGIAAKWEDNQSAIAYSRNALVSEKTKHFGLK